MNCSACEYPTPIKATAVCCTKSNSPTCSMLMTIAERVSAIALGALSLTINRALFGAYFVVGFGIGVFQHIQHSGVAKHVHAGSCANSLLEQLTGVKLPAPISLMTNLAVTIAHIEHHSDIFVPIIGISLGAWAGQKACHYGALLSKKIEILPSDISFAIA